MGYGSVVKLTRNYGLDLGRFIAASIVALGHLLFTQSLISEWSRKQIFLEPFKFGALSVTFFFCLSGFVLAPQIELIKRAPLVWLKSRLIRLLPLYYFSFIIPMFFFILLSRNGRGINFPNGIPSAILGFLASQSFTSYYLDLPNPPLWSLSVEIWLSIFLVMLTLKFKFKDISYLVVVLMIINVTQLFSVNAFLGSMHFFLFGILIRNIIDKDLFQSKNFKILNLIFVCVLVYFISPKLLIGEFDFQYRLTLPILVTFLVVFFSQLTIKNKLAIKLCEILGARTYSLYAVHFPILIFLTIGSFRDYLKSPIAYISSSVIFIALITEITYRFIEKPSLKLSRSIKLRYLQKVGKTR